jgi:hypothetical protein
MSWLILLWMVSPQAIHSQHLQAILFAKLQPLQVPADQGRARQQDHFEQAGILGKQIGF